MIKEEMQSLLPAALTKCMDPPQMFIKCFSEDRQVSVVMEVPTDLVYAVSQ